MTGRFFHNKHFRRAIGLSLIVNGYIAAADWGLVAMHHRGVVQGLLGFLDGISAVLQVPGMATVIGLGFRHGHHTTPQLWFGMLAANFMLWVIAGWVAVALLFPSRQPVRESAEPAPDIAAPPPERVSRRALLTSGLRVATVGALGVGGYSLLYTPRRFEITRRLQALRGLRPELDGLRVVQLTDIHHGPNLSLDYVREVIAATNALRPDVVLLTGDYVYRSPRYIVPVVRELAELRGSIGVVGVLGNHDWWEDATMTRSAFAQAGIPLIDNSRIFVTPDRKLATDASQGLCIAGVGDYLEDYTRFDAALAFVPESMPRLLLSHNPDAAEDPDLLAMKPRIDLMICGHTHGGQVRFPVVGSMIVPSRYGQKYALGLVKGPACDVYVSRGIGTTILPIRFNVPPEIALMELRSA